MDKKKVVFTVLLAALIALALAFIFTQRIEKIEGASETSDTQEEQIKVEKEKSIEIINVSEKAKKTKSVNTETAKKQIVEPVKNIVKETQENIEQVQEASIQNDELNEAVNDVEIPVKFVSNNTYKYIYTPAKFPKKKLKAN